MHTSHRSLENVSLAKTELDKAKAELQSFRITGIKSIDDFIVNHCPDLDEISLALAKLKELIVQYKLTLYKFKLLSSLLNKSKRFFIKDFKCFQIYHEYLDLKTTHKESYELRPISLNSLTINSFKNEIRRSSPNTNFLKQP